MGLGAFTKRVLKGVFGTPDERLLATLEPELAKTNALEATMRGKTDAELRQTTARLRERHAAGSSLDELLPEAFAAVREAGRRILGMRHYDVQIIGAIILHRGNIAEMVTGEGKTLVATPSAYLNAIPGKGVHVVTVNDYLAKRDRDWMAPVYEALGMTVGVIQHDLDNSTRQTQYGCDITYGTNNEFGFDYLRDNMKVRHAEQVHRGYHYAIVDEVDSILVDEARTPLIIAGPSEEATGKYYEADRVVRGLIKAPDDLPHDVDHDAGEYHFVIKEKEHQAFLTDKGLLECERRLGVEDIYATADVDWPHHLTQALRAHHLYKRDQEYVVKDGEIIIVDEFTGRMMPGRRWSDGLHQAVEAKEGQEIQAENQTLATITLQNYFKLYSKLAGMTGTAKTEEGEFDKIYKLGVVVIPTNRPLIRSSYPDVVYMSEQEKYDAIVEEIARLHATGRPILVGTTSIEKSEVLSGLLQRRGVPHQVLNAKHHEREASIVARAGQLGQVTIATNMAGRGTDIILGTMTHEELLDHWREYGLAPRKLRTDLSRPDLETELTRHWARTFLADGEPGTKKKKNESPDFDTAPVEQLRERLDTAWAATNHPRLRLGTNVKDLGGLHILGTERHDSRRIDNQLRGRSGRQGDPGSSQFFLALDDSLMRRFAGPKVKWLLQKLGMREGDDITSPMVTRQIEKAQGKVELHNFEIRKNLLEYDEVMNEQRKTIYGMRQNILEEPDQHQRVTEMLDHVATQVAVRFMNPDLDPDERDAAGLAQWLQDTIGLPVHTSEILAESSEALPAMLQRRIREAYAAKEARLLASARERLPGRIAELTAAVSADIAAFLSAPIEAVAANGPVFAAWLEARTGVRVTPEALLGPPGAASSAADVDQRRRALVERVAEAIRDRETQATESVLRRFESYELLDTIDSKWKDHLLSMDHLRDSIGMRGYAQVDPKVEYKKEGYQMFRELLDTIRQEVVGHLMRREPSVGQSFAPVQRLVPVLLSSPEGVASAAAPGPRPEPPRPEVLEAQREAARAMRAAAAAPSVTGAAGAGVGRNDPCPCGSGRKYKKCHGASGAGDGPPAPVPVGAGAVPATGKNKPCPCGSGKKYKQCHGAGA